jgi:hypothetical protein
MNKLMILPSLFLATSLAWGQGEDSTVLKPVENEAITNLKGAVGGLNESYLETKATVDKLAKIKVSGMVQAQWQFADSMGIKGFSGGDFPANSQERFQVRRGRLKTTYETLTSKYVLQFDVVPSGLSIKDAYATLMEPWFKTFSYTMGVFDRPFGFEIGYSSSSREAPERTRMYQTLFPGERDLGAKLEINPQENWGLAKYLNLKGGLFTGMGPTVNENDNEKDFIGHAGFSVPFYDINLSIDGGASAYLGKVTDLNDTVLSVGKSPEGITTLIANTGNFKETADRNIFGFDGQVYYDLPVVGGLSLRGEYLWGEQPGTTGAGTFYAGLPVATPALPTPAPPRLVTRNVAGWYIALIQNLGSKVQAVARYDLYDPNTDVKGSDIGVTGSALSATDLAYSTVGLGMLYYWDESIKFTAYYDIVKNEEVASTATGTLTAYQKDLSDNVFTFRMQVKF